MTTDQDSLSYRLQQLKKERPQALKPFQMQQILEKVCLEKETLINNKFHMLPIFTVCKSKANKDIEIKVTSIGTENKLV